MELDTSQIQQKIDVLERKIDLVYSSVERTRKYFLATLIVSAAVVLLPLLGLAVAVPVFLRALTDITGTGLM